MGWPAFTPLQRTAHDQLRQRIGVDIDTKRLAAGIRACSGMIGLISLIRFGHLHNVADEDALFTDALERLGRSVIGE